MLNNQMVYWLVNPLKKHINSPWLLNPGWFSWGILLSYIYIFLFLIIIIQERGIPINQPGLNGMTEGF